MINSIDRDLQNYCQAHPLSPTAITHPRVVFKQGRYVAFVGRSIGRGVLGFGSSVFSALRSFDEIYPSYLRSQRH